MLSNPRKYRQILAFPSIDTLISAGLIQNFFSVSSIKLKFRIRRAQNSILIGVASAEDSEIINSFIIDNTHCERYWGHTQASNIFLCDHKFGSITDFLVETFDLMVPENILDAVFQISTINFAENSFADDMFLVNLILRRRDKYRIIDFARQNDWNGLIEFIKNRSDSPEIKYIKKKRLAFLRKTKQVGKLIILPVENPLNILDIYAARSSTLLLSRDSPLAMAIIMTKRKHFGFGYSTIFDLTYLRDNLSRLGINALARPHYIYFTFDDPIDVILHKLKISAQRLPKR